VKILHIINTLENGGAQSVLAQLLENWGDEQDHQMVITLRKQEPLSARIEALGVRVKHINLQPREVNIAKFLKLIQIIRSYKPDVIQTWLYHSDLIGGLAALLAGYSRVVWGVHHTTNNIRSLKPTTANVVRVLSVLSHLIPAYIICCSHSAYQTHLSLGYPKKKMIVILNGVDATRFQPSKSARGLIKNKLRLTHDVKLVGMFARYHPQKDHHTLFRAAGILVRRNPRVHFVLAGESVDVSNEQLLAWSMEESIQNNIHMLGDRQDMPALIAGVDIITLTSSHGEALPQVLGEAMACGIPCVATNIGDVAEFLGGAGIIVEPQNPQSLADAWHEILSLPEAEYKDLCLQGRKRICEFYNIKDMVNAYKSIYWKVNEGK